MPHSPLTSACSPISLSPALRCSFLYPPTHTPYLPTHTYPVSHAQLPPFMCPSPLCTDIKVAYQPPQHTYCAPLTTVRSPTPSLPLCPSPAPHSLCPILLSTVPYCPSPPLCPMPHFPLPYARSPTPLSTDIEVAYQRLMGQDSVTITSWFDDFCQVMQVGNVLARQDFSHFPSGYACLQ